MRIQTKLQVFTVFNCIFHCLFHCLKATPPNINGIYFTNEPAGQANFDYQNFDNSVKQAINSGFNRVYIGNFDYNQISINVDPKQDVLLQWSQLSTSKISSVKNLANSKNSKICMIATNIGLIFDENPDDFVQETVSVLNELMFDCVVFDLRQNEFGYPINSVNAAFLSFILEISKGLCENGFDGEVVHVNYARNLGNFMSYGQEPKFPTVYADTINQLPTCLESVNLDYFIDREPSFQTDQKSLFQNSTGLTYANADYGGTAISEITKNNNISAGLLVIGKPIPYMGLTDPDDLACWREDVPYETVNINNDEDLNSNETIAGFVTWPFVTQAKEVTALDWAKDVRFCVEPVTESPVITSGSSLNFVNIYLIYSGLIYFSF